MRIEKLHDQNINIKTFTPNTMVAKLCWYFPVACSNVVLTKNSHLET